MVYLASGYAKRGKTYCTEPKVEIVRAGKLRKGRTEGKAISLATVTPSDLDWGAKKLLYP